MFKKLLEQAIGKYLNTTFPSEANRAKTRIIKVVNAATEPDARKQIKEVLAGIEVVPQWLENHFTPGSLFVDRGRTWGWWRDNQLQAEIVPLQPSLTGLKQLTVTDTN
ncbi:hypothetical protein [Microcoleus sp. D3_18a_C4]|uniref:hypothetical protein n=1 Tax=Microcoleus sp. D3_18a_C4 TaxID=3055332 RepID=UPI002FCFBFA4